MSEWHPTEKPYRVLVHRRSSAHGLHGWRADVSVYATETEAAAAFDAAAGNILDVSLQIAENADDWKRRGRWKTLRKRRERKPS